MNAYTAHTKPGRDPILVKEGWSWAAFLFGPVWLATHRAWIPALVHATVLIAVTLAPPPVAATLGTALAVLAGLFGRDLLRWSLERRGYLLAHVLAARDTDAAWGRLFAARPDLAAHVAGLVR